MRALGASYRRPIRRVRLATLAIPRIGGVESRKAGIGEGSSYSNSRKKGPRGPLY
jgi:hypothetical protein